MSKQKRNLVKQTLIVFALMAVGLSLVAFAPSVFAQGTGLIQPGDSPTRIQTATNNSDSIRDLVLRIVDYFLFFLGLVATLMVIYGGIIYVTAAGEQDAVDKAKKIISYSLIGIIIILLSFALVNTIINAGTGSQPSA